MLFESSFVTILANQECVTLKEKLLVLRKVARKHIKKHVQDHGDISQDSPKVNEDDNKFHLMNDLKTLKYKSK